VLLTIGSGSLAEKICTLLRRKWPLPIISIHLSIVCVLACVAGALGAIPAIVPAESVAAAVEVCVGVVIAIVALKADRAVLKALVPTSLFRAPSSRTVSAITVSSVIAILEEVLFRGYLVHLGQLIVNPSLRWLTIIATIPAFALSHAYAGLEQAMAKVPLGLLTLCAVLNSRVLLPAIVAHIVFNVSSTDASVLNVTT